MLHFFCGICYITCQNTADFQSRVEGSVIKGIRLAPFLRNIIQFLIDLTQTLREFLMFLLYKSCGSIFVLNTTSVKRWVVLNITDCIKLSSFWLFSFSVFPPSICVFVLRTTSVQRRVVLEISGQSCKGSNSAASTIVGKMSTNSTSGFTRWLWWWWLWWCP